MLRFALVVLASLALAAPVEAAPAKQTAQTDASKPKPKPKKKRRPVFSGTNAPKSSYRKTPLEKPSGTIWLKAANLNEEVRVNIYRPDGTYDYAAMAKIDELFRCLMTGEVRAVRAELYEQLSRIQDHFGGKQLEMVSGFRLSDQSTSRHYHASAADFRIKGVSIYEIKKYAETLDTGNMGLGIYPNTQFIHIDVRAPGEPSFRWTDYSGRGLKLTPGKHKSKKPARTQPARKPVS